MVKIGAELPKLSRNKTGYPFYWTTLYMDMQSSCSSNILTTLPFKR